MAFWIRTYQMMWPISGNRNHRPHKVVIRGCSPASTYSFSTSLAIRNMVTGEMKMVINWVSQVKVDPKDLAPSVDYQNPDYD